MLQITDTSVVLKMLKDYCQDPTETPLLTEPEGEEADVEETSTKKSQVTLLLEDVPAVMRLTHAMCFYTVQGRTLRDHTLLIDTNHPKFSRRALIVGLSRATHGDYVHIASAEDQEIFLGKRRRVVRVKRAAERAIET